MVVKYTIAQFCTEYGLSQEYIRQCCRSQLIGVAARAASLPKGWRSKKVGKRWYIVSAGAEILKTTKEHESLVLHSEDKALIDILLEKWHNTAIYRNGTAARPTAEVIQVLRESYLEAVSGRSGNWVECKFRFFQDGTCKAELKLPNRFRQLAIETVLRANEKRIAQMKMQFIAVWLTELNYIKVRKPRAMPASFARPSSAAHEVRNLCINCGRKHHKRSGARFCTGLCRDAHRNWLKRLPKQQQKMSFRLNKRFVDKVLPNLI